MGQLPINDWTDPVFTASQTDLAWAAGIIDGEGCIVMHHKPYTGDRTRRHWTIKVTVGNTDGRMLQRLAEIFQNGTIVEHKVKHGRKRAWHWTVASKQAERVLLLVRPFLVVKGDQADVALRSRELILPRGGKRDFVGSRASAATNALLNEELRALKRAPQWIASA